MSDLTAERYLSNIGFDDSHLPEMFNDDDKSYYKVTELMEGYFEARNQANGADKSTEIALHKHIVMPRISYFIDENGNNVDLNAEGINAKLKKDGTFEYYRSFGFAGRKELTPVYGA